MSTGSNSYERHLIDTEDGEEPDVPIGYDDTTMQSTSKKIQVINNNPNSMTSDYNQSSIQYSQSVSAQSMPATPPILARTDSLSSIGTAIFTAVGKSFGSGSVGGSVFTMCISIVGAGCLALPYALRNVGLIFGIFLIFLGAPMAYFTLDLLLISAEYLPETLRGPKPLRNISYQSLAAHSYGNWLSRTLQVVMAIQYFGSMIAYVVAYAGFIDLVYSIFDHPKHWPDSIYTYCVIGICYGVIFPLSLLRSVDSLRFTSFLGFSMSIYLVLVVTVEYFVYCHEAQTITNHNYETTCFWSGNYHINSHILWNMQTFEEFYKGFLTAFPLVVFAYTGHPFLMPLYVELAEPSINKMRKVFKSGLTIINILYFFISVFGFLLFLDSVCSNLLLNDFRQNAFVIVAALGIATSCILTEPIFSYNFRRMIGMLVWDKKTSEITTFWHVTITFIFVSMNVALGVAVKSIAVVFGFLGSTTYPFLGYILPAAFFVKITPPGMYKIRKKVAIIQACIVGFISLCSLGYKIYSPGDQTCDNAQSIG